MKAILFFLLIGCFSSHLFAQYDVTGIHTDFNTYWKSTTTSINAAKPDKSHNLLAFTWNGTTFSTGVDDANLTSRGVTFSAKDFRALPIDAVGAVTGTYIGLGQLQDGVSNGASNPAPFTAPANATVLASYLIDGVKGLNLGTAIANIPSGQLRFTLSSQGIASSSINDGVPDVLVTQVAAPSTQLDSVYFVNASGAVVGNRLSINHTAVAVTGKWMPDFYHPNGNIVITNSERDIRLWAADLTSFGITAANASQAVALIYKLNGNSDVAFVAFNAPSLSVATKLTISTQAATPVNPNCCGKTGTAVLPQQPVVQVSDASGNNILQAGITVTASVLTGPAGHGALTGTTTTVTNSAGQAIFTDLVMPCEAGNYTLTFTSSNLEPATSATITVVKPTFYVKAGATANLASLSSWSSTLDGSGAAPENFNTGKEFILNNTNGDGTYTTGGNWTVTGRLVIPSGKTLVITNGTTTTLSCDVSESGTIQGGTGSTLLLNGTSLQTLSGTNELTNFTINNVAGVALAGNTTVAGTLGLTSGILEINNATLTLNGSIARTTGSINATSSSASVIFSGSAVQQIPAGAFNGAINNLTINNAAGININADVTVSNQLQLTNGNIVLNNYDLTTSTIAGGSASTYVKTNATGRLRMNVSGSVGNALFPVGNSSYNPVRITNNNVAVDQFAVRVLDEMYENSTSGNTLSQSRIKRTWNIQKAGANTGAGIGFLFNWSAPENSGVASPVLHHYQDGWQQAVAGTTTLATASSLTYSGYTGSATYFGILQQSAVLPLLWKSFTVSQDGGKVNLHWETASEERTLEFVVERSSDGVRWSAIGKLPAAGYSVIRQQYSFTDAAPQRGNNYYRIKQVDADDRFTYSSMRMINLASSANNLLILGNPVSGGSLIIRLDNAEEVNLFDTKGNLVWKRSYSAGTHRIPAGTLTAGVYVLSSASGYSRVVIPRR